MNSPDDKDKRRRMNSQNSANSLKLKTQGKFSSKIRTAVFLLEIILILALLVLWLSIDSIHQSKNLWVLFLYSFPSEFLIAIVPHEPLLLYFGKFYPPLIVALVAVSSTILTEILNYSVFKFITDFNFFNKVTRKKTVNKVVELFNRAPFAALWIAGFTPVPFYPFRLLVVMARYSLFKYALAVFLSRGPRFFLLALVGHAVKIPDYLLGLLFVALIASINLPLLKKLVQKKKKHATHAS